MRYSIYQRQIDDKKYQHLNKGTEVVSLKNYARIYKGELKENLSIISALEKLFFIFNVQHPSDFVGHSLSVSDIVEIDSKFYYCQPVGWQEITARDKPQLDLTRDSLEERIKLRDLFFKSSHNYYWG